MAETIEIRQKLDARTFWTSEAVRTSVSTFTFIWSFQGGWKNLHKSVGMMPRRLARVQFVIFGRQGRCTFVMWPEQ